MRLSIIIPVYNVAEYLQKCIDSVLANDCSDCEIILVDDGATDGLCPRICDENAAAHPELIRVIHQKNQGLGGARNTGIQAATGEYLFFVDSDDAITPDALALLSRSILETGADIYSFGYYSVFEDGRREEKSTSSHYSGPFSLREHPEFLFAFPVAWARVWRRSLFTEGDITYPSRVWYEDIRTSTKLFALARSIVTLPQPLYCYLQRTGSIMHTANVERNREIILAFQDIVSWFREKGLFETYRQELCRLAIEHLYLAASVRVARADPGAPLLKDLAAYMQEVFPDFRRCTYLHTLTKAKRLALWLVIHKHFRIIRFLFRNR